MKKIIFIVFVLVILAGSGLYLYKTKNLPIQEQSLNDNPVVNIGGVTVGGDTKGVKIEPIEIKNDKPMVNISLPNLDKEIKITATLDENAKKVVTAKIQDLSSQLKKNSNDLENWLVLGVYRKTIGDLEGAKEVWEHVATVSPKNATSFNNLGELYAYYLKDNKKAEENYVKALENDPSAIYIYRNFFDFYRYVVKDTTKARALLEKGIVANPSTSSDLKNLLQSLQ